MSRHSEGNFPGESNHVLALVISLHKYQEKEQLIFLTLYRTSFEVNYGHVILMIRTLDLVRRNLTNKDCTENEQTLHFFPVSGVEGRHDNENN